MGLLSRIRRLGATFRPLEEQLLAAVEGALGPPADDLFRRQVKTVNKVQRLGGAREVNLYRMRGGRPQNPPELTFPDRRREAELATVRFRLPGEERSRRMTLHLVEGFLFSLTFEPAAENVLDRDDAEVLDVRLATDPTQPRQPQPPAPRRDPAELTGLLGSWHERYGLSEVGQPLEDSEWRRHRADIPANLPETYTQMIRQAEGFTVGPWRVHGLAEVYGISLDEADYQVLAEFRDEGVIAVEEDGANVYFVPFDQGPRRRVDDLRREIELSAANAQEVQ